MNLKIKKYSALAAAGVFGLCLYCCQEKQSEERPQDLLNLSAIDSSASPQQDFFEFANGSWLSDTKIPASEAAWGAIYTMRDQSLNQMKFILDSVSEKKSERGDVAQKVGDLYASAMDSAAVEKLGLTPIQQDIDRINGIKDAKGLMAEVAHQQTMNVGLLYSFYAAPDDKNSSWEMAHFDQGGLGLPNRDYYFKEDSSIQKIRKAYVDYMSQVLQLLGSTAQQAEKDAGNVMKLETSLAEASKDPVALRDPNANYHKMVAIELDRKMPQLGWPQLLTNMNVPQDTLLVGQPEFYKALGDLLHDTPVYIWKNYLKFHLVNAYAPYLSNSFVTAQFEFNRYLTGLEVMQPRWKRMSRMVDSQLGDALGQLYVKKYFPPESKARMEKLVDNLQQTYADRIKNLDWMSDSTKTKALDKMHAIVKKIGYPDKWKDYSSVDISRDSLVRNIQHCRIYAYNETLDKIGKPVDRSEWFMTPPTVNAYYNPNANDINFPAGILQPPVFYPEGDDALNYGAIGMVIGHEMTHGFDDQGRQYDALGNLKDWWSAEDAEKFMQKAQLVVDQYNNYTVLDSLHLNGKLTLGENIADIGGVAIAYGAFKKTQQGQSGEKIDGFTPDQRFFMSLAQIWRLKYRDQILRTQVLSDPHSPARFRVNGPSSNMESFYTAFNVKPGDKMYRPDSLRIHIW